MAIALHKLSLLLALSSVSLGDSAVLRFRAPRMREPDSFSNLQGTYRVVQPQNDGDTTPTILDDSDTDNDADLINLLTIGMSMPTTEPSAAPTSQPSATPTLQPSSMPSHQPTAQPSAAPSVSLAPTTFTPYPTLSMQPSASPTVSMAPSSAPTEQPSSSPSMSPTTPVPSSSPSMSPTTAAPTSSLSNEQGTTPPAPTAAPSSAPSSAPSFKPSLEPSGTPTLQPSAAPSGTPSIGPSSEPSSLPSASPTLVPSSQPSSNPTPVPTVLGCTVSADVRNEQILAILDANADPALIRNSSTPQGMATDWLLENDPRILCPDAPKILQRWVLAVMYFATSGDTWFQCSNSIGAIDLCGEQSPFENRTRFLSGFHECEWAGIACNNTEFCVTEIEFELNNLTGFIPSELGLLTDLERWGMERGNLTGTIPTEIEKLSKLVFLDLDYNKLTGSLTTQLLSLTNLQQLDLNNNQMTGLVDDIDVFPDITFLQLHDNLFSGTIPEGVGNFVNLRTFTIHETDISGTMPDSVCDLLEESLESLISDCGGTNPDIECDCCTECRVG